MVIRGTTMLRAIAKHMETLVMVTSQIVIIMAS